MYVEGVGSSGPAVGHEYAMATGRGQVAARRVNVARVADAVARGADLGRREPHNFQVLDAALKPRNESALESGGLNFASAASYTRSDRPRTQMGTMT